MSEILSQVPTGPDKEHPLLLERLAFEALSDDNINWLKTDFPTVGSIELRSLETVLMAAYAYNRAETELIKKKAMRILAAEHITTITRYVDLGVGAGYLTTEKNPRDRRAELIRPTEKLISSIEKELTRRARKQQDLVNFKEGLVS